MFDKLKEFFATRRGRLLGFLAVAMVLGMASAQEGSSAFTSFQSEATGLITQWSTVAVTLCGLWVAAKLAPKFIKRLTGAV